MIRELCRRCGIHTGGAAYCQDCIDVESLTFPKLQLERGSDGRRIVRSARRGATLPSERAELLNQVRARTLRGETAVQIALAIGVTSRTVARMRARLGIHGAKAVGADHWGDYAANRERMSQHQLGPNASGIRKGRAA